MTPEEAYKAIQDEVDKDSVILEEEPITAPHSTPGNRPLVIKHYSITVAKSVKEKIQYTNDASSPAWAAEQRRSYFDVQDYSG